VAGFKTSELWQWRKPAPDFVFLTGSCAYFNEPVYDRPGKPYGGDSSIFETMAKEKAAFMMWLGDNWYTREADYFSEWGLWYRASHDRALPVMKDFLKNMAHYAIWDDHDYGFNDADKSFIFRNQSTEIFKKYWANPSYGQDGQGIYTKVTYSDCDFFLMDDRSFRTSDRMVARIGGKPNPDKKMWGDAQLEWLKNSLRTSNAIFKIIVTGSQTLNAASPWDCLQNYPIEFDDLMNFLTEEKINGVLFITGDRHHSEINKWDRTGTYSLFDITSSALTSGVGKVAGGELNNPGRLPNTLVEQNNYARITVSGAPKQRILKVEFIGVKGELLANWSMKESELRTP
jgi:alkaline phosphatase D